MQNLKRERLNAMLIILVQIFNELLCCLLNSALLKIIFNKDISYILC